MFSTLSLFKANHNRYFSEDGTETTAVHERQEWFRHMHIGTRQYFRCVLDKDKYLKLLGKGDEIYVQKF